MGTKRFDNSFHALIEKSWTFSIASLVELILYFSFLLMVYVHSSGWTSNSVFAKVLSSGKEKFRFLVTNYLRSRL